MERERSINLPLMDRRAEAQCELLAPAPRVFEHIDTPERLSAHMGRRRWQMAGAAMSITSDALGGRAVGSRIAFRGRMLGIALEVECVVVERRPPTVKQWETVGDPRLVVIGPYRMTVRVTPRSATCVANIAIDYALPSYGARRVLGHVFGALYARWCVTQMARDLAARFDGTVTDSRTRPTALNGHDA